MLTNKKILRENLTPSEKGEVKDIIKTNLKSREFEKLISDIVKKKIDRDKELGDKITDISKNVLSQLFKLLWMKKSFWKNNVKNKVN